MESILKERILDFHQSGIPTHVRRDADVAHVKDMVTTIVGGRKTGKTYLTYQVIDDLLRSGRIDSLRRVCYLHFDDEALAAMRQEDLAGIDRVFLTLLDKEERKGTLLFVFDEIHCVPGWESFVLRLKKRANWLVIVTGSTAEIEEDTVARQLRGKTFTHRLHPLSFREFLRFSGFEASPYRLSSTDRAAVGGFLDAYLDRGSYPAAATLDRQLLRQLLQNYFNSIVASDFILGRGIQTAGACKTYLRDLLQRNACPYTHKKELNNLRSMGFPLAPRTVSEWFAWAEESYLLGSASVHSPSAKRVAQNYRKVYCCDWAMANSVTGWSEKRLSRSLEAMVYWHLVRQGFAVSYDVAGTDKSEIDFVVSRHGERPFAAVQVCVDLADDAVVEREVKGLAWYAKRHPGVACRVIALAEPRRKLEIPVVSALDFLLGNDTLFGRG